MLGGLRYFDLWFWIWIFLDFFLDRDRETLGISLNLGSSYEVERKCATPYRYVIERPRFKTDLDTTLGQQLLAALPLYSDFSPRFSPTSAARALSRRLTPHSGLHESAGLPG